MAVLSRIAKLVRAGSSIFTFGDGLAKRTMAGLSVAVVVLGASTFSSPAAGASPLGAEQAQLRSLQEQVVGQASRIRTLTLSYEQANTKAGALAQQVATDQANLARLQNAVGGTTAELRNDAIISYTGGVTATPGGTTGTDDPAVRAEYLQVAGGDLSDAVDRYRTEEALLGSSESALTDELKASRQAVLAAASARQAAIADAGRVQALLVSVQDRIQQLQAQAAAAQAAAAKAAAARAAATQGLPVNDGLVSVVRTVVSPAPPSGGDASGDWLRLRECESGDNYQENTGNGFFGAYQFSQETWTGLGYPGRPDLEPPAMQDQAAQRLQAQSGWGQWPACSAALGLD